MADGGDARDERLSGLLEVEPLDELARRRLVSTAMRASAPPTHRSGTEPAHRSGTEPAHRSGTEPARSNSRRLVAAAAIAAAVIAGGLGYLVSRDSDSSTPTASRAQPSRTTTADAASGSAQQPQSATPASPSAKSESTTAAVAPTPHDAGNFGDLRMVANVARLRRALAGSDLGATSADAPTSDRGEALLAALRSRSCASELPNGTVVAVATGRFGTRDAIVAQTELPDGTRSTDAVVDDPCEVRPLG